MGGYLRISMVSRGRGCWLKLEHQSFLDQRSHLRPLRRNPRRSNLLVKASLRMESRRLRACPRHEDEACIEQSYSHAPPGSQSDLVIGRPLYPTFTPGTQI